MTDKPLFDFDVMTPVERRDIWPELVHYLASPADAMLAQAIRRRQYDESARREHHQRRKAKWALRREAMGDAAR